MNTTVHSTATEGSDQAMPGAMDRVFNLPEELVKHFFEGFVIPDMHIMVRRKRTFTAYADQYHIELLNPEEWRDFLHLAATNTDMRIRCKQAFKDAQKVKSISVVMDMSRHAIDPRRRVPNSLLGTEAPMWLLRMMKRLTVLCPYVIQSTPTMDGKDTEIVTKQIRSTYQLYPPFTAGAPQPGQNDTILSVDWLTLHYEAAPDSGFAFATAASDNIEYALRHARVAQRSIPTPYLPVVTPKGLYDLGLLFTEFAGTCAVAKEAIEQGNARFRLGSHQLSVEWQQWIEAVEEEEMERSDSEDEDDGEEDSGDRDNHEEGKEPVADKVDGQETSRDGDHLTGDQDGEDHGSGEEKPSEDGDHSMAGAAQQEDVAAGDVEMIDDESSSQSPVSDVDSEAYTSSENESDSY
ncbi:unnamed protein product [Zymoseptoria tritici ST99CH_1A5]|uniref:Uncharacterized protein n=1 Tax=Zymoseptoria tritici ST99CH_1A5 TaxID=1276529 RepID=A0A1Y6LQF8_ZYMTR|nr:unnamed protein product [Zymoseptoria tritici ST99CH_1A5]